MTAKEIVKAIDDKTPGSLGLMPTYGAFYCAHKILERIRVNKTFKRKHPKKVFLPPEIKEAAKGFYVPNISGKENDYTMEVIEFAFKMRGIVSDEAINTLYRNLETVKLIDKEIKRDPLRSYDIGGYYSAVRNLIRINPSSPNFKNNLFHELMHLSSSYVYNDRFCCGFKQFNMKEEESFGEGLNEGYTELLCNRYFGINLEDTWYAFEVNIARLLEKIVGKKLMEKSYFRADIKAVIDKLKEYAPLDEIMNFICKLDYILAYARNDEKHIGIEKKNVIAVREVSLFLLKIYGVKLLKDDIDKYSKENLYYSFVDFREQLEDPYSNFQCIENETADSIINEFYIYLNEAKGRQK